MSALTPSDIPSIIIHHADTKYTQAYIRFHYPVPPPPPPPPKIIATTPQDRFCPVPDHIGWPNKQAPAGARHCEELNAFVPDHLQYSIRGYEKLPLKPSFTQRLCNLVGWKRKHTFQPAVLAKGLTHARMNLIPLDEARRRPDIVYRTAEPDVLSDEDLVSRGFYGLVSLEQAKLAQQQIRSRAVA